MLQKLTGSSGQVDGGNRFYPLPTRNRMTPTRFSVTQILGSLALILTVAVYDYGGVKPVSWTFCLAAIGLLALVYFVLTPRSELAPPLAPALKWLILLFLGYVAFQLLPLPLGLIRIISPNRAELLDALYHVVPGSGFAPLSIVPAQTLSHLLRISAYTLVFLLVREVSWRLPGSHWTLAMPLLILATFEGLLGVLQFVSSLGESAHGTYYNRNHYAGFLEMILPFAILYPLVFLRQSGRFREIGMGARLKVTGVMIAAGLIFLGILCSLSRMGFTASVCSILAMAAGASYKAGFFTRKRALAFAFITVTILAGLLFFAPEALVNRFSQVQSDEQGAFNRTTLWHQTLPLIAAYPLFGCGFGGFESAFIKFKSFAPLNTADFAHNDYLQILAELGVIGFTIGFSLLVYVLVNAIWSSSRASQSEDRFLALACTGAITAILVHSIADFNLYIPANAMLLAWIAGIATALSHRRPLPTS